MIQLNKRFDETMLVLPATLFLILFSIYPLIFPFLKEPHCQIITSF
jgi:ABC-type sugar transport system permease subunit